MGWKAKDQKSIQALQHYTAFLGRFAAQASTPLSSAKEHKHKPPETPQNPRGRTVHSTLAGVGRGLGPAAVRYQRGSFPRAAARPDWERPPGAAEPLPPRGGTGPAATPARPRPGLPPGPRRTHRAVQGRRSAPALAARSGRSPRQRDRLRPGSAAQEAEVARGGSGRCPDVRGAGPGSAERGPGGLRALLRAGERELRGTGIPQQSGRERRGTPSAPA